MALTFDDQLRERKEKSIKGIPDIRKNSSELLDEVQGWISAAEELPEDYEYVLISDGTACSIGV